MLYTLIVYICATAAPCQATPEIGVELARGMSMEQCASAFPAIADSMAAGRYFIMRCKLEDGRPSEPIGKPA